MKAGNVLGYVHQIVLSAQNVAVGGLVSYSMIIVDIIFEQDENIQLLLQQVVMVNVREPLPADQAEIMLMEDGDHSDLHSVTRLQEENRQVIRMHPAWGKAISTPMANHI